MPKSIYSTLVDGKYQCKKCQGLYNSTPAIFKHRKSCGKKRVVSVSENQKNEDGKFHCLCKKTYETPGGLRRHKRQCREQNFAQNEMASHDSESEELVQNLISGSQGQHDDDARSQGQHDGSQGQHDGSQGQHDDARSQGQHDGSKGQHDGSKGQHVGSQGQHVGSQGQHRDDHPQGQHSADHPQGQHSADHPQGQHSADPQGQHAAAVAKESVDVQPKKSVRHLKKRTIRKKTFIYNKTSIRTIYSLKQKLQAQRRHIAGQNEHLGKLTYMLIANRFFRTDKEIVKEALQKYFGNVQNETQPNQIDGNAQHEASQNPIDDNAQCEVLQNQIDDGVQCKAPQTQTGCIHIDTQRKMSDTGVQVPELELEKFKYPRVQRRVDQKTSRSQNAEPLPRWFLLNWRPWNKDERENPFPMRYCLTFKQIYLQEDDFPTGFFDSHFCQQPKLVTIPLWGSQPLVPEQICKTALVCEILHYDVPELYAQAMKIVYRGDWEPVSQEFYGLAYAAFLTSQKVEYKEKCKFVPIRKIPMTRETFMTKYKQYNLDFLNKCEFAEYDKDEEFSLTGMEQTITPSGKNRRATKLNKKKK